MTLYQRLVGDNARPGGEAEIEQHAFVAAMRLLDRSVGTQIQMANRFALDDTEKAQLAILMALPDVEKTIAVIELTVHGFMTPEEGKATLGIT